MQSPHKELRERPKAEVVENGPYRIDHVGVKLDSVMAITTWDHQIPIVCDRMTDREGRDDDKERPDKADCNEDPDCRKRFGQILSSLTLKHR